MSLSIYAAKVETLKDGMDYVRPIFDFPRWSKNTLAPDADARTKRGLSAFIPNPDYVEDAGMTLPFKTARLLFDALGLEVDELGLVDITEATRAAMRLRNSKKPLPAVQPSATVGAQGAQIHEDGISEEELACLLEDLQRILAKGRAAGSTILVVG